MRSGFHRKPNHYVVTENWTSPAPAGYDLHAASGTRMTTYSTGSGMAARFECQPGDDTAYSERAEVVLGSWSFSNNWKITGNERDVEYYRLAIKLEAPWTDADVNPSGYRWVVPFQLHGQQSLSPAFALQAENLRYRASLLGGDCTSPPTAARELLFADSSLRAGEWVEFVIEMKWSLVADGHCVIYRRNPEDDEFRRTAELFSVPTLQYIGAPSIKPHYAKTGIYRSASAHTSAVHIGPVIRTTERLRALSNDRIVA